MKKKKIIISITATLFLIGIFFNQNISKQIVKSFGESEYITMSTRSIGTSYYMPYFDEYYVDLYSQNMFTDTYIYKVKLKESQEVEFGDTIMVNAKIYNLGNKFAIEYIDGYNEIHYLR